MLYANRDVGHGMADCADLYFVRSFASGICFYERQYYTGVIDI